MCLGRKLRTRDSSACFAAGWPMLFLKNYDVNKQFVHVYQLFDNLKLMFRGNI